jgi:transcriptional regulator GlxA family with amidase domain
MRLERSRSRRIRVKLSLCRILAGVPRISAGLFAVLVATNVCAKDAPTPPGAQAKQETQRQKSSTRILGVVLYPDFELLDVCGPAEMFGNLGKRMRVVMVAQKAGQVASKQGPKLIADYAFNDCPPLDLVLVPGGFGTIVQLNNRALLDWLKERAQRAEIVTSVCSGASILAKAGLLDGRPATTNKQFYRVCTAQGPKVKWIKEARWVDDGNIVTSSGVTAGIDMAIHLIARLYGTEVAQKIADATEYRWHSDPHLDPFAKFAK